MNAISKRKFALISAMIGAIQTVAVAVVTYISPSGATAINSAIIVGCTAITTILSKFVQE